jgi:phosphoglycerol transferase MdoB-like AlkP superfamily enzyme
VRRAVSRWGSSPRRVVGAALMATVVLAFAVNGVLDLWRVGSDLGGFQDDSLADQLPLFLLGTLVVWLFVVLLVAALGRLWVSIGLVTAMTVLLGYANYRKQQLLLEPLYPSDLVFLTNPGFLEDSVGAGVLVVLVVSSVALVGGAALVGRAVSRWFPRPDRRSHPRFAWRLLGARVAGALVAVAAIGYVSQFHDPGNLVKAAYEEYGAHWRPWHQSANYADNGFVGGMLYNLPVPAMQRPAGYGPRTMHSIMRRYSHAADRINRTRDPAALSDVNIVVVLGEAFSDPTRVAGVELARDPMPFTRALMRRTTAGNMWSTEYGGGTANVEFEALTGMSMSRLRPQMTTPFQMLIPGRAHFPSAVTAMEREGLRSLAVHSFSSALYRRAQVYPALGFDDTEFQDEMARTDRIAHNPYISDRATYDETLAHLRRARGPLFMNVVTMQNHFPYAGKYEHPIAASGLPAGFSAENLEHYARGLRRSDAAMRHFIARLEASAEKTVIVFYGDHLPPVWPPAMLSERTEHETPFFVYANFGVSRPQRLPTTSPIYLMNHALARADAPVPPYYAMLTMLEQEVPTLGQGVMIGPDNRRAAPGDISPRGRRLLRDYRLVQYDLAVGRRFSEHAMLGVRDGTVVQESEPGSTRR